MTHGPFDGKHGPPHPSPCKRAAKGARTSRRARPDRPTRAQAWGAPPVCFILLLVLKVRLVGTLRFYEVPTTRSTVPPKKDVWFSGSTRNAMLTHWILRSEGLVKGMHK
jgi:hypothetical protein